MVAYTYAQDHMTALEEAKKQSSREAISLLIAKEKKYDLTGLLPKVNLARSVSLTLLDLHRPSSMFPRCSLLLHCS